MKMRVKITSDDLGVAYWPDIPLSHVEGEWFDPNCEVRGEQSLHSLLYMTDAMPTPMPAELLIEVEVPEELTEKERG